MKLLFSVEVGAAFGNALRVGKIFIAGRTTGSKWAKEEGESEA